MIFTYLFYKHIMFRKSCGKCYFANMKRPSDITLADFWGWEKDDASINADDKGLNLVLINTPKGRELFEAIRDRLTVINATPNAFMQPNLQHPSVIHRKRNQFEKDYVKNGFEFVMNKDYDKLNAIEKGVQFIKRCLRFLMRKIIKK